MNTGILLEAVGYLGSGLVVISMLMTSVKKLRIINTIGSVIFVTYAILIGTYPTALMNIALVIINIVGLFKLSKNARNYKIIRCFKDESVVRHYLSVYNDDIKKFFPDFTMEDGHLPAFLVINDATPIGIITGELINGNELLIDIDYTIPSYRDNSVGSFLYDYLNAEWGIEKLIVKNPTPEHEGYILKMGFLKEGSLYQRIADKNSEETSRI